MKIRPLVFVICLALCVKTLDCQLIGGKHDVSGRPTSNRKPQRPDIEGSGSELDEVSESGDYQYPVEPPPDEDGSGLDLTTCQMLYNERVRDNQGSGGGYVPQCMPDGQFVPLQCHYALERCWCVDVYGQQIAGSLRHGNHKPDCTDYRQIVAVPPARLPSLPVTRNPITPDDGIIWDHKAPSREPDVDVNVIPPNGDDDGGDVEYRESRVSLASRSLLNHPGILAAIIGGGVLILLCVILLLMFIVYRMRKKDEGSYALDEPKKKLASPSAKDTHSSSNIVYTKAAANDREFYA